MIGTNIRMPDITWRQFEPGYWMNTWGGMVRVVKPSASRTWQVIVIGTPGHSNGSFGGTIWKEETVIGTAKTKREAMTDARKWMKENFHWNKPKSGR